MSAAAKSKPEGILGLSPSEARLMLLGTLCTDSSGKVNYDNLATKVPYKNAASASTSYRSVVRKFHAANGPGLSESETPGAPPTPAKKTPAKRKKAPATANADAINEGNTGEDEASPTPKPKRQRKAAAKKDVPVKTGGVSVVITNKPLETEDDSVKADAELDENMDLYQSNHEDPLPSQPDQKLDLNTPFNSNPDPDPNDNSMYMNPDPKTEEEEIMTQLSIETEFAAMECDRKLAEERRGSAWLAPLPYAGV